MSDLRYIVADCGGTSTNWAFCYSDGSVVHADTPSMHPKYLLEWSQEKFGRLRSRLPEVISAPLFFYSAGCNSPDIAGRVQEVLVRMGFSEVSVYPDTIGACRACCGNSEGSVAIFGTGSVLLRYDGKVVTKRTGGWGSLIGDEGSGFHFGKLLLRAYLQERALEDNGQLASLIGTKDQVLSRLAGPKVQQWIAGIGDRTSALALVEIHRENIRSFLATHLPDAHLINQLLHVVGSYGWFQQQLLNEELAKMGLKTGLILKSPLEKLVIYHAE